ncbi:hypothetical protein Y032_0132g1715 [Ancylostoma ceylanicum]|uniref:Uncharacterized protein n=1 Tax=Ancylostoma ceylanicum TaxID=53326 RepID=A0A016T6G2_9BILA|nr:hypothetical protein Y032_0132g1715 [Ancylostoma ceylanicum]
MKFLVLLALVPLTMQNSMYRVQPSGYGNNNPREVQYAAGKSPRNKPVDYTSTGPVVHPPKQQVYPGPGKTGGYKPPHDEPAYSAILIPNNMFGNNIFAQTLGQANTQGQQNLQKGGNQKNIGANNNQINPGAGGYQPSYDAPTYTAYVFPRTDVIGNRIDAQTLGQINNQGQANVQQGGQQTNTGSNTNAVNVGQTNFQGTIPVPSYDARGRINDNRGRGKQQDDKASKNKSQPIIINNYIYVTQEATQGVNTAPAAAPAATTA